MTKIERIPADRIHTALAKALIIRKTKIICPECQEAIEDGFNHYESCKYYEAELIAQEIVENEQ